MLVESKQINEDNVKKYGIKLACTPETKKGIMKIKITSLKQTVTMKETLWHYQTTTELISGKNGD